MEYQCKICGKIFINSNNANITKIFKKHLENEHKTSLKEYIIKYYYNGEIPKCACGCGENNKWYGKNALFSEYHGFSKFCSCTHVNGKPQSEENIIQNENKNFKYICLECGKEFLCKNKSASHKILKHIKNDHNLQLKDYILKHYFNNKIPVCACGCGEELSFYKKNAIWNPLGSFGKYVSCSHVGRNNEQLKSKLKEYYKSKWENIEWLKKHYYDQYGQDNIENSVKDFLENDELTNIDINKKYGIDIRTLKNIWLSLKLITKEQWIERCNYRKYKLSSKRRKQHFNNKEEICAILYNIIKYNPQQYSITSLIKYYNENYVIPIEIDTYIILESLIELYGEEIYDLLQFGIHSKEENEFIKVLKYLVKGKYKIGLRLQYGTNKRQSYIYDICINNTYIIEYDGEGYYHKNKEYDKQKEKFAKEKGYKIIRISYKQFRDPKTYIKINKLINND